MSPTETEDHIAAGGIDYRPWRVQVTLTIQSTQHPVLNLEVSVSELLAWTGPAR